MAMTYSLLQEELLQLKAPGVGQEIGTDIAIKIMLEEYA